MSKWELHVKVRDEPWCFDEALTSGDACKAHAKMWQRAAQKSLGNLLPLCFRIYDPTGRLHWSAAYAAGGSWRLRWKKEP